MAETNATAIGLTKVRKQRGMKLNVSYIAFIASLKQSRTAIVAGNRDSIAKTYETATECVFTNLPRVSARVQREELAKEFTAALSASKLSLADFQKLDEQVKSIVTVKAE